MIVRAALILITVCVMLSAVLIVQMLPMRRDDE